MRRFWCLAFLCNFCVFEVAVLADQLPKAARPNEQKSKTTDIWTRPYEQAIRSERKTYNNRTHVERIVGGGLAFALGTYGYYNDKNRQIAGKLIYSATQSGGILAISNGIVGLSTTSPILALDEEFQHQGRLTYPEYRKIVVESSRSSELAGIQRTAISAGLLAALYSYNSYLERRGNVVLRNTFGFMAFNFTMFSSVSFYRWYTFGDDMPKPASRQLSASLDSWNSMSLKYTF
jgi:hypothetical protein